MIKNRREEKIRGNEHRPLLLKLQAWRGKNHSLLLLVAANLLPLVGIFLFSWDLFQIIALYWLESAVIGFWNVAKLVVVGRVKSIFLVPFFIVHYGIFMTVHLTLIMSAFGVHPTAPSLLPWEAMRTIFHSALGSLLAFWISHGVSFFQNFLGRGEYRHLTVAAQMQAPYRRVVIMHLAVMAGGFFTLAIGSPRAMVIALVGLKTIADVYAHVKEHGFRSAIVS